MNRKTIGAAMGALLLSFAAFVPTGARAAELQKVQVVLPSFGLTLMPALIAHEQGFDHEAGLDFAFTQSPGSIGTKALIAGDFQFSLSVGALISAAVTGAPVRALAVHIPTSFYYLYARKGIASVKDLSGKSIGVGAIGDSTDIAAREALRAAGVNASTVNFVSMGIENVTPALIAGALDAGVVTPPRDIQLDHLNKFNNLGFLGKYLATPTSGFGTTKKMIDTQPKLVQAFTNVVMRGSDYLRTNKQGSVAAFEKFMKLSPADAALAWDKYVPQFTKDGLIDTALEKRVLADQIAQLHPRRTPTIDDVFDFHFLKKGK